MKRINGFLRFTQLLAALTLIGGWFLHEPAITLMKSIDIEGMLNMDISRDMLIQIYYYTAGYAIGITPVR